MLLALRNKATALHKKLRLDSFRVRRLLNLRKLVRAVSLLRGDAKSVLFVTPLLCAREQKMAFALREAGWKVALIYLQTTPFKPDGYFDEAIQAHTEKEAHLYAKWLSPRLCHVFSGAVDGLLYRFCTDKPGPIIIDINDVFCASLFDYCHERFEPTRECLERADGLCARDLQAKSAEKLEGYKLPRHTLLFPEYSWLDGPRLPGAVAKSDPNEVHVVSVGTFCLESQGMHDSGYLRLAEMLTEQRIHFHIYPHWFYRKSRESVFNHNLQTDFVDFFRLAERTPYLHIHESLPLDELARVLPQYDFGIVAGGSEALGQKLKLLKPEYMKACYSGRIADYIDARLPVLINREVRFDFWLLQRYGLAVDLGEILSPGFREHLLAHKHDRAVSGRIESAATTLSLKANIGRLATFYDKVIKDTALEWVRLSLPLSIVRVLPGGHRLINLIDAELDGVRERIINLSNQLAYTKAAAARERSELQKLVRRQDALIKQLQYRIESKAGSEEGEVEIGKSASAVTDATTQRRLRSIIHAKQSLEVERGRHWADEISGLLNWPEIKDTVEQTTGMPELMEMIRLFSSGNGSISNLSSCWQALGFKNFNQLLRDGYSNFKRTVGCSYFNFLVQSGDPQIAFLEGSLSSAERKACAREAASLPDDPGFSWDKQEAYRYFVLLLWAYANKMDVKRYLHRIEEPEEGNPVIVPTGTQRASQDLANSVLEYYSMAEGVDFTNCKRVLEIGGGYGRDAFVVMKLNPHLQYTLVDIPPALWIAQRYLSSVFPERKVFHVRDFHSYAEVANEMESASVVFLLPHQLELLPDRRFDLTLNISSFGEMQRDQIDGYFQALERLSNGHFYMKQWQVSQNAFDSLVLTEDNYPVPPKWKKVYSRPCAVQTAFFETLYRTK